MALDPLPLPSLLSALYDYLLEHIRWAPTLNRHLARHGSHFQTRRYDNDAVAQHLGFHEATNFRRSFKRWTGLTPSLLRDALPDLGRAW